MFLKGCGYGFQKMRKVRYVDSVLEENEKDDTHRSYAAAEILRKAVSRQKNSEQGAAAGLGADAAVRGGERSAGNGGRARQGVQQPGATSTGAAAILRAEPDKLSLLSKRERSSATR
jgi:hypothetical protein